MVTPVSNLTSGQVTGRFAGLVGDTILDSDTLPDSAVLQGNVTLSPSKSVFYDVTARPVPTLVAIKDVTAILDSDGYLSLSGSRGVSLMSTDPEDGEAILWTATFDLSLEGASVPIPAVTFPVDPKTPTDLVLRAAYVLWLAAGNTGSFTFYVAQLDLTPTPDPVTGGFGTTPFGTGPFGGTA